MFLKSSRFTLFWVNKKDRYFCTAQGIVHLRWFKQTPNFQFLFLITLMLCINMFQKSNSFFDEIRTFLFQYFICVLLNQLQFKMSNLLFKNRLIYHTGHSRREFPTLKFNFKSNLISCNRNGNCPICLSCSQSWLNWSKVGFSSITERPLSSNAWLKNGVITHN